MNIRIRSPLSAFVATIGTIGMSCVLAATPKPAESMPDPSDQAISDRIDDELLADEGVISTKIYVLSSDGIVTLTGHVNNILAKERSARIAETVKGVRSVINRIAVRPSITRSDAQIRRDVEAALVTDPATDAFEITTTVKDGAVTLMGSVDSYQERALVTTVAKGVRGVTAVHDKIQVLYKTDRDDSEIKHDIEQTLRWNVYLDDAALTVSVSDGNVVLSGTVDSAAEKRLAESDAWVAGVTSIDSSTLVVHERTRDDRLRHGKTVSLSEDEVREAVQDALLHDPRVMSFNVDVDVVGRTVTLRGNVDNLKAKRAAEQDATNTVGVASVKNRLKVRLDPWPDDQEVAEDIRHGVLRDPYLSRFEVTAVVIDGVAHLYGAVDSTFEKHRADEVASGVAGVLAVENHLRVDHDTSYVYDPYVDDFVSADVLFDTVRRVPRMPDDDLEESIESELWWSPFVDSETIAISIHDGVVTLTGTVDSWRERRAAARNAYEGGAAWVDNDLVVARRDR